MRTPVAFSLAGAASTFALTAAASPLAVVTATDSSHSVQASLGLFSVVGLGGVTYAFSGARPLVVELGAGLGFSGLQLSLTPKLAFAAGEGRFLTGAGASLGLPWFGTALEEERTALWLNVDALGYELRFANHLLAAATVGVTIAGFTGDYCVAETCESIDPGDILPQGRVTLGYWF
jgi:hypothetical protein